MLSTMTSHRCSVADLSGENAGYGNTLTTLLALRTGCTIQAVCGVWRCRADR